ncbi:O-antigen ligase family protein [Ramlibacter tataouinensis]|uniref:Candidate membrane protein n=1 Tax=Ramlibacter tataouinensis (strain ATCC BAA-407 / DSM 14655 / LMG 21543 / TTB310) TaxID=365046 RepID=F5XZ36_RAMTT|nr:O-antigen ligase family protein [Ramlibacter tataouinensis]AEG93206.1 candidate membrane protein [Ramlibacter tataouinensis TTB310]
MTVLKALREPALPPAPRLAAPLDRLLAGTLAVFGFVLPFSPPAVALAMLALLLLLLPAAPALWRSAPWRDPVIAVGLALLAYIALHTWVVSGFTASSGRLVNHYHELLMAAVLLGLFRLVSRPQWFFFGLALGAVGYAAVHWLGLAWQPLAEDLSSRRISAGFGLALCAFLLLDQSRRYTGRVRALLRAGALFLAATVLFAIDGRTGHVVLLVLVACAAWWHSPPRLRWAALVALPTAAALLALSSTAVQSRLGETLAVARGAPNGELTSTGIRMELLHAALEVARGHYATGAGFARYGDFHSASARARDAALGRPAAPYPWAQVNNPHNEFLMQLVGGGVLALALFLAWLGLTALRRTAGRPDRLLIAMSLAFATGCLFNSLLRDFAEGHLYVALLAWALARSGRQEAAAPAVAGGGKRAA